MTIILKPEQEQVLREAIKSGLAHSTDEALNQALDALRERLLHGSKSTAEAVSDILELRQGVTLGGLKIKDLIHHGHRI